MNDKFGIWYWKLAYWKLFSGICITLGTGWITATTAVKWSSMDVDERTVIIITIGIGVFKFCDGFFDQTVSRLVAGKAPVPINGNGHTGDTKITTKTETTVKKEPQV